MEKYIIEDSVVARAYPSSSAPIVNAYKTNSIINIVKLDNGWYTTDSGTYIFKSKYIKPYGKWLKEHEKDHDLDVDKDDIVPKILRNRLRKYGGAVERNDVVTLNTREIKDLKTGNLLPTEIFTNNKQMTVISVDGDKVVVKDGSNLYTVPVSVLTIVNTNVEAITSPATEKEPSIWDRVRSGTISGSSVINNLDIKTIRTVFGSPYQFTPLTDLRSDGSFNDSSLGRLYVEKIASRAPILVMQAGVPEFLRGFDKEMENKMIKTIKTIESAGSTQLEQMINQPGQYYGFKAKVAQYFGAVNAMCKAMATYLGLDRYTWELGDGSFSFGQDKNAWDLNTTSSFFGYHAGSICFYVNSEPQINELFNNRTTKSMIDKHINQLGEMGSELKFLLGGITGMTGFDINEKILNPDKKEYSTSGSLLDSIIDNVQTVLAGGRMIFPEIWQNSEFIRSYSVNIKLVSPDADNLSIFLNILVPLAHILGFVLPRSIGNNNYISPYLVRAFYRSMFHIDMGIVTDCQIQRGDTNAWNSLGLPTQMTIQLTIKDLYSVMSMALAGEFPSNKITSNPLQLDYIANLCGINMDAPDLVGKTLDMWAAFNNPATFIPEFLRLQAIAIESNIYSSIYKMVEKIFGSPR